MTRANRGEWSELYAIGFLLVNGGGFAADDLARLDESIFYKVLQVVDNPTGNQETLYTIEESEVSIYRGEVLLVQLPRNEIEILLVPFFEELIGNSGSSAFTSTTGIKLMELLRKSRVSANSSLANDLYLVLEDLKTKLVTPKQGFNIKSEVGNPATVFNASGSTNITFRIIGDSSPQIPTSINGVKAKIHWLINNGYVIELIQYDSDVLYESLENIDSNLPKFLAELMLAYYSSTITSVKQLCDDIWPSKDPHNRVKIDKIKKFLSAASMGLRAGRAWSGYPEDFGGLLLVKSNGDVLFYYLYNLQKFEEYLFNSLRFETPSASRHRFGEVYFEDEQYRIKLNLQIRF